MTKKLFAFWRYDTFPFYLGGEVEDINDKGQVYIKTYQGWFNPFLILPYEEGVKRDKEITMISKEHAADTKALLHKNTERVNKILKFY